MTALRQDLRRRILGADDVGLDRTRILHQRRKAAMAALLAEFENEIVPHIEPGHEDAIEHFKRSTRGKLNGLVFAADELMQLVPGERFNQAAADLAEQVTSDANGGTTKL